MSAIRFNAAIFGKPRDGSSYAVQGRSPAFPIAAEDALLAVSQAFEFQSAGPAGSDHGDCFAVWPVDGDGCLVARISDAGADRFGRRHTLRIEAVHLPKDVLADDGRLPYRCLSGTAWPPERWSGEGGITLAPTDEPAVLSGGALPDVAGGYPRLVRLTDAQCRVPGFDWTLSNEGMLSQEKNCSRNPKRLSVTMPTGSPSSTPTMPPLPPARSARGLVWLLTLLLVLSLTVNALLWVLNRRSETRADETQRQNDNLASTLAKVEQRRATAENDCANANAKLELEIAAEDRLKAIATQFKLFSARQLRERLSKDGSGHQMTPLSDEQQLDEHLKDVNAAIEELAAFVKKSRKTSSSVGGFRQGSDLGGRASPQATPER